MFIFPVHAGPEAYPTSHSFGIQYYFSGRRGWAKRPGREAGLWVTPTIIQGTLQPFLPGAFDRAATTLPFQTMCLWIWGLSQISATNTFHNISGPFPSTGCESALYNTTQYDLCSNKPLVHLDEGICFAGWEGLASISEPENHNGASLANRQALGDLPTTETAVLQVQNRLTTLNSCKKTLVFRILRLASARMEEHSGRGQGLNQVMV